MVGIAIRIGWLVGFVLAGGGAMAQDAAIERQGKHYKIVLHRKDLPEPTAGKLADESLAALEAFWPLLEKLLPGKPPAMSTVHLYRAQRDQRNVVAREKMTFPRGGFLDKAGVGHVALLPELTAEQFEITSVPHGTLEALRFVAAEQAVLPFVPGTDEDGWLRYVVVMGAVELAANPKHLDGVDAGHDNRRAVLIFGLRAGHVTTFDSYIGMKGLAASREAWEAHQSRWALTAHLLSSEPNWAKKLLGKQRELKGHVHAYDRRKVAVESVLGSDWKKIEARWTKLCSANKPTYQVHGPEFRPGGPRLLLVGSERETCLAMACEPPPAGDYVVSGTCEFGPVGKEGEFRIELGWDSESLVAVHLQPGYVGVHTWSEKDGWSVKADRRLPSLVVGKPFAFRIEVTSQELRVAIDGEWACAWPHGGRETHGACSLVTNSRLVWLQDVRIEPLAAAKK